MFLTQKQFSQKQPQNSKIEMFFSTRLLDQATASLCRVLYELTCMLKEYRVDGDDDNTLV